MLFQGKAKEFLDVTESNSEIGAALQNPPESTLTILWTRDAGTCMEIDSVHYQFVPNQLICLTEYHGAKITKQGELRLIRFNRPFFCIVENDSEIGCKGILFFGASQLPVIDLEEGQLEQFELIWKAFLEEIKTTDNLQMEMLQMVLKRMLILSTRLYKKQLKGELPEVPSLDIVREFNYQVERNFKKYHHVADYAELLHKSPKTLSNVFTSYGHRSPLNIIHERILLEARRLLYYSDRSVKEISYEVGFEDIQAFSRFFKNKEGVSPTEYREKALPGKIANSSGITS